MSKAEGTGDGAKDSIFRVPQRIKNTLSLLTTASFLAGCFPKPTQPPIGATDMPEGTNPATTLTVEPPTQPSIEGTSTSPATPTLEPTVTLTETPTPTEVPMASRPDFESMSDADMAKEMYNYMVLLEGQLHFSQEELEALPFASAPPELIKKYDIRGGVGMIEWSAELVGNREIKVVDENGQIIGKVFVGLFGGEGDKPGNRKIFSALLGSSLWGTETYKQGGLVVGSRYDMRISYADSWRASSEGRALEMLLESIKLTIGPNAVYPNLNKVEDLIFGEIRGINLAKISNMDQFYQGLPTDADIMLWPENFY